MATVEKHNWGLGFLLSVVLAAGMVVNSYINFQEAQAHCFQCFEGQYDLPKKNEDVSAKNSSIFSIFKNIFSRKNY